MWVIGAGIMVSGLVSMVFAGIGTGLIAIGIGAIIAIIGNESDKWQEKQTAQQYKSYPTYKY